MHSKLCYSLFFVQSYSIYVNIVLASLIFHKVLLPVIRIIREHLGIRVKAYCDDIIFLDKNIEELMNKQPLIL
ncbi:MAG: hypothetical protein EZS28_049687 [Streblomastix strix]|uniref:Reverse transcriptase domain-containing protein n=1 Tax=Streblomastix strix TaxID=222440 RepID=A0A5J4T9B8_9EUKA|nr:MAG: hypothetical protein EZS28_049687 [Streblomastix strix]